MPDIDLGPAQLNIERCETLGIEAGVQQPRASSAFEMIEMQHGELPDSLAGGDDYRYGLHDLVSST
jgi:hypothetical protein